MEDKSDTATIQTQVNNLEQLLSAADLHVGGMLEEFDKERPPSFVFWRHYMHMVSLLLQFLQTERKDDWKLHLAAFSDMLPWFAVYNHTNYTRWGDFYLADMKQSE